MASVNSGRALDVQGRNEDLGPQAVTLMIGEDDESEGAEAVELEEMSAGKDAPALEMPPIASSANV